MDTFTEQKTATETPAKLITSRSPATGRILGQVQATMPAEVGAIMQTARRAQPDWYQVGVRQRAHMLRQLKDALYRNFDRIVDTIVAEQGRPPFEAMTEFNPAIELLAYYSRSAPRIIAPRHVFIPLLFFTQHRVERRPHGVVAIITPWNFPLLLSIAPIAAALVTGNTVIYKPSEFATQFGEVLTSVIHEAGIPREVFQLVQGEGDLGAALIAVHPDKICFTGSVATGRKIAAAAGELLIPLTLELGGKDAAIVLEDADLDRSARGIAWGSMFNAGQVCASIERVYVMRSVADQLAQKMAKVIEDNVRVGAGEADTTTMGAITTAAQIKIIESQVREAVTQGAKVIIGNQERNGQMYCPTLLTNVTPAMRIVREETFGPVIVIMPIDSDEDGIAQANATTFGLTGSVWTRNRVRGLAIAQRLNVGHAAINDHIGMATIPQLPWGGQRESGYGRTRGPEGLLEMTTTHSISAARVTSPILELFWYPYTRRKYNLIRRLLHVIYAPTAHAKLKALFEREQTHA